jgi:hypothetical protein
MYGVVTVQRAKAKSAGGFEILPFETSLKLINGKATITEAETDGTGPIYDSAYLFRVQNGHCAPRWGFMAALPDGTTPITTGELPIVDPITGEGIYMDAQEWNELYGDLPNRVESLEGRVGGLEALGGLSPESPVDGQTANLILQEGTLTQEAVDSLWLRKSDLDGAVAGELAEEGSATNLASRTLAEEVVAPIRNATDPLAYLDNVKLFAQFPVRESGEMSWVQGFTIMFDEGKYYVSNQQGTSLRIDQRSIGTNSRAQSRTTTTENEAYSESIDMFRNGAGHLISVVWPKTMTFPGAYALYNYSTNVMGPQIPINGLVRGARYGDIFVTSDSWGNNAPSKFYIYDWESIKAGTPELLQEIPCKSYPRTAAKNQGMAYNDGFVFFAQGSQSENMTITAYNSLGTIELVKSYGRASMMEAFNKLVPGLLTNPDYLYECEGAYSANGKLYTLQIVNNNPSVTSDAVALILEHNNIDGVKIESYVSPLSEVGPWVNVNLLAGWTHQAQNPLQVRVNGNRVEFQGSAVNSSFVGGFTNFATLPEGIPKPKSNVVFSVPGNTTASRAVSIWPGGDMQAYSSAATSAWYGLGGASYPY